MKEDKNIKFVDLSSLPKSTVGKYLRLGKTIGITDYDGNEVLAQTCRDRNMTLNKQKKKPLAVYKDKRLIGVFSGCIDLANNSLKLFGRQFKESVIAKACKGDINSAYGYTMKYIDKNEYTKLFQDKQFLLMNGGVIFEITT